MNYGYNSFCKGWQQSKQNILAHKLSLLLERLNLKPKKSYENYTPYLEVNGLYNGIRIRRITHLSRKDQDKLVKQADKVYDKVMNL